MKCTILRPRLKISKDGYPPFFITASIRLPSYENKIDFFGRVTGWKWFISPEKASSDMESFLMERLNRPDEYIMTDGKLILKKNDCEFSMDYVSEEVEAVEYKPYSY